VAALGCRAGSGPCAAPRGGRSRLRSVRHGDGPVRVDPGRHRGDVPGVGPVARGVRAGRVTGGRAPRRPGDAGRRGHGRDAGHQAPSSCREPPEGDLHAGRPHAGGRLALGPAVLLGRLDPRRGGPRARGDGGVRPRPRRQPRRADPRRTGDGRGHHAVRHRHLASLRPARRRPPRLGAAGVPREPAPHLRPGGRAPRDQHRPVGVARRGVPGGQLAVHCRGVGRDPARRAGRAHLRVSRDRRATAARPGTSMVVAARHPAVAGLERHVR
jgi:hypothetical protein